MTGTIDLVGAHNPFLGDYLIVGANNASRTRISLRENGLVDSPAGYQAWYVRDDRLTLLGAKENETLIFDPLMIDGHMQYSVAGKGLVHGEAMRLRPLGHRMESLETLGPPQPRSALRAALQSNADCSIEIAPSIIVDNSAIPSRPQDIELLGMRTADFLSPRYNAEPVFLHIVNDATLFNGVTVATAHGRPLWHTTYQAELRSRNAHKAALEDMQGYYPPKNAVYQAYYGETTFLLNTLLGNYGHWNIQSLGSLSVNEIIQDINKSVIKNMAITLGLRFEAFRKSTLSPNFLDEYDIIDPAFPKFREAVLFKRLLVPSFHRIQDYERFHPLQVESLRRRFLPQETAKREGKLIYISRADIGDRRAISNEPELIEALRKLNFEIVVPGRLSVDEQRRLFEQARLIVAPHGGGLTNMFFSPRDVAIFEIFHELQVNSWYRNIARILGFDYHYTVAPLPPDARTRGWDANFVVDIPHCIDYIKNNLLKK